MTWRRAFLGHSTRGGVLPRAGETVRLMLAVRNECGEWVRANAEGSYRRAHGWRIARHVHGPAHAIAWSPLAGFVEAPLIVAEHEIAAHPPLEASVLEPA